jgi:hypothetical protein
MTQEEKDLLVKDLCARLPYGVIGQCEIDASYDTSFDTIFQTHKFDSVVYGLKEDLLFVTPLIEDKNEQEFANEEVADGIDILDFKPYLFPLSSMSEEQKYEFYLRFIVKDCDCVFDYFKFCLDNGKWHKLLTSLLAVEEIIDWFHKNHIDYRGLIPMGLAIDATNINIY